MGFSVLLMTTWTCQGLPTCWKMQGTTHAMVAMSQCSQEPVNSSLHISICCRYATQTTDVSHRTLHTSCVNYMYRQWCTHWILVETTSQPVHFIWQEVLALGGPHWQRTSGDLMSSRWVAQKHIHLPCCCANVHVHIYPTTVHAFQLQIWSMQLEALHSWWFPYCIWSQRCLEPWNH